MREAPAATSPWRGKEGSKGGVEEEEERQGAKEMLKKEKWESRADGFKKRCGQRRQRNRKGKIATKN